MMRDQRDDQGATFYLKTAAGSVLSAKSNCPSRLLSRSLVGGLEEMPGLAKETQSNYKVVGLPTERIGI